MQTTENMREKTFNMRLTPEEWARFEAVADHYGLPVASMIRMLVKEVQTSRLMPLNKQSGPYYLLKDGKFVTAMLSAPDGAQVVRGADDEALVPMQGVVAIDMKGAPPFKKGKKAKKNAKR